MDAVREDFILLNQHLQQKSDHTQNMNVFDLGGNSATALLFHAGRRVSSSVSSVN